MDWKDASLEHIEARKRNEPYMPWHREGRLLFISEIPDLSTEQLQALVHDINAKIESLRSELDAERLLLNTCGRNMPMQAAKSRALIGRLSRAIESAKLFKRDAHRVAEARSSERREKREKLRSVPNLQSVASIGGLQSKRDYFKRRELMNRIRQLLGDEQLDALSEEARRASVQQFVDWAGENEAKPDWVEHILNHEMAEAMRVRARLAASVKAKPA